MKQLALTIAILISTNLMHAGKYLAKYDFNGNSKNSVNGQYAKVNGATLASDRHGRSNSAYHFDGIDDFIEITGGLLDIKNNESFTMETYVYMEKTQGYWGENKDQFYDGGALFSLYGAAQGNSDLFFLWYSGDKLIVSHRSDQSTATVQQNVIYQSNDLYNKYQHIVVTRNSISKILSIYVNGKLVAKKSVSPTGSLSNYNAFIGVHNSNQLSSSGNIREYPNYFFKGKMDYLRFYKRALSAKKVKKRYKKASQAPHNCDYYVKEKKQNKNFNKALNQAIKVYPNPTRGNVYIKADAQMDCREIRIYNHCGQVVMRSTFKNQLNTGRLQPGYYTVVFLTPSKNFKRRLVVVR